jgi:phosphatidylglycerol---prolipoprotein diacylglyceryl transferase
VRPILFEVGGISVFGYGTLQVVAVLVFTGLLLVLTRRLRVARHHVGVTLLAGVVSWVVGAKGLFVVLNLGQGSLAQLMASPGLIFSGGILAAATMMLLTTTVLREPGALDVVVGASLGFFAVSDGGCLLAGCCTGHATTVPWALTFDGAGSLALDTAPRHALPLYSAFVEVTLLVALLAWRGRRPGQLAFVTVAALLAWKALVLVTLAEPLAPRVAALYLGIAALAAVAALVLRLRSPAPRTV